MDAQLKKIAWRDELSGEVCERLWGRVEVVNREFGG